MYISETNHNHNPKPQPPSSIDFSDDDAAGNHHDMMIEVVPPPSHHHHNHHHPQHHQQDGGANRLGPKKRAETWVQDETLSLISLRREMDALFNTSKSNKHLWEQISTRMRGRGFDRSPTMCTDKWRNLLKEFKKVKHQLNNASNGNGNGNGGNGSAKMSYYKEIEEILRDRSRPNASGTGCAPAAYKSPTHSGDPNHNGNHLSKVDPFLQFSDKGIDDDSIPFGPIEGDETHSYSGRVIAVKWGDYTRRVGVDGTADAIKDVIRSAFGLRTKRAFWLEDEDQIIRSLDRDMPLGTYTLHLDEGVTIKFCHYEESDHISYPSQTISHTEEKTFYTEEEFREFMHSRGWSSLRELNGYRNIDNLDDFRPDALYRGVT